jgi:hypothetical protein
MSWSIGLIDNTVEVPEEFAAALFAADENDEVWYDVEDVLYKGKLSFDDDHREHMDYVWRDEILAVLLDAKVTGRIAFASVDGDNSGKWWSYSFVDGVVTKHKGEIKDMIPS